MLFDDINAWFSNGWGDTNAYELDEEYVIEVRATGLDKSDIKLSFDSDGALKIFGKYKTECDKNKRWLRHEFSPATLNRRLILPDDVDKESVHAKATNGILEIHLAKLKPNVPNNRIIAIE